MENICKVKAHECSSVVGCPVLNFLRSHVNLLVRLAGDCYSAEVMAIRASLVRGTIKISGTKSWRCLNWKQLILAPASS